MVHLRTGRALALLALLALPGSALAQQRPALPPSIMPWAHPSLPGAAAPAPAAPVQNPGQTGVPASVLRPSERTLIDCKQAPKDAITQVPQALARWATIYCTKQGHLLTTNERFYSAVPGTQGKLRGVLGAAAIAGKEGEVGHGAYFTKIEYAPLAPAAVQPLIAGVDPKVVAQVKGKPVFRLDLTANGGQAYHGVVIDPERDPFWVIPIVNGKIGQTGFYAATVDYVNRTRTKLQ